jgi:hypothetical protein
MAWWTAGFVIFRNRRRLVVAGWSPQRRNCQIHEVPGKGRGEVHQSKGQDNETASWNAEGTGRGKEQEQESSSDNSPRSIIITFFFARCGDEELFGRLLPFVDVFFLSARVQEDERRVCLACTGRRASSTRVARLARGWTVGESRRAARRRQTERGLPFLNANMRYGRHLVNCLTESSVRFSPPQPRCKLMKIFTTSFWI